MPRIPMGFQKVTATSSAFSLTVPPGSKSIDLVAEVQNIRWRDDGVDPTATVGQLLVASASAIIPFTYFGNLAKIRFIAAVAGAILNAEFYKT